MKPVIRFCVVLILASGCATERWSTYDPPPAAAVTETPTDIIQPRPRAVPPEPLLAGDGPLALSVEQAVLLALRQNRDLSVDQLQPVIVGAFEQIERGVFDPELFLEAEYQRETASEIDRGTGAQFSVKGREERVAGGIRQRLPTGTEIEAGVSHERDISNRAPEQQEARLGLTVTQSLLRGFGPAVNLARVRQAELDTVASTYELRGFIEALLAEVEIAYWRFVLATEEISIFENSVAIARRQRDEVNQGIEAGMLARIEAAAAEAQLARREQALIDARSQWEAARLRLVRLVNPDATGQLARALTATTAPRIEPEPITDLADRLALAERQRPDLAESRLRLEQRRLETIVTRNGVLPRLDAFIALGKTGFANTFNDSFRALDGDTYDVTAGVSFTYWLGDRAAEGRNRAARFSFWQAEAAVENLKQLIELDVRLAVNDAERARQQIAATATTRAFQEQTVAAEQQRFEVGSSTALLVAQAQRDLLEAQIAEIEAVIHYRIALVTLYLQEGSLLERRGIMFGNGGRD